MLKESEFKQYDLKRGQARGAKTSIFSGLFGGGPQLDESGQTTTEKSVGKFKALITITRKNEQSENLKIKNEKLS